MNFNFEIIGISFPFWVMLFVSIIFSCLVTWFSIPTIVKVAGLKKLFDVPNERTSHVTTTPILGGLSIFAGFTLSAILFTMPGDSNEIKYIIGAIIVLFFAGLKDDILIIDPVKKIFSQIIAALIIVVVADIRISNFHTAIGIENISYISSILFTIFLIITLINGFNLIDGVDGLTSAIGIITSLFFGIWFLLTRHYTFAILCFSLIGSLAAYFIFNVFGKKNKVFMGDTGSMIIGLVISIFAIKFLEFENSAPLNLQFHASPALAFGLLIIPLFDTLRIIILRLRNGGSPFAADRNHVHHNLLKLGYSHLKVTTLTVFINLIFIILVIFSQRLGSVLLILITLSLATVLSALLEIILKRRRL